MTTLSRQLLQACADRRWDDALAIVPNIQDDFPTTSHHNGKTAFVYAASMVKIDPAAEQVALAILDRNPRQAHALDRYRSTALMWAAAGGSRAVVEAVLGVTSLNIDAMDTQGQTALMIAASRGNDEAVERLLTVSDANLASSESHRHDKQRTALSIAVLNRHLAVVRRLVPVSDMDRPRINDLPLLLYAVSEFDVTIAQVLLEAGAETWSRDERHTLVFQSFDHLTKMDKRNPAALKPMVDLLIQHMDPITRDRRGATPLMKAALAWKVDLVTVLLPISGDLHHHEDGEQKSLLEQVLKSQAKKYTLNGGSLSQIADLLALRMDPIIVKQVLKDRRYSKREVTIVLPCWSVEQEATLLRQTLDSLELPSGTGSPRRARL